MSGSNHGLTLGNETAQLVAPNELLRVWLTFADARGSKTRSGPRGLDLHRLA